MLGDRALDYPCPCDAKRSIRRSGRLRAAGRWTHEIRLTRGVYAEAPRAKEAAAEARAGGPGRARAADVHADADAEQLVLVRGRYVRRALVPDGLVDAVRHRKRMPWD